MANFSKILNEEIHHTYSKSIFGVVFLVFSIGYITPADLARAWAGGIKARKEFVKEIARKYHLDLLFEFILLFPSWNSYEYS